MKENLFASTRSRVFWAFIVLPLLIALVIGGIVLLISLAQPAPDNLALVLVVCAIALGLIAIGLLFLFFVLLVDVVVSLLLYRDR